MIGTCRIENRRITSVFIGPFGAERMRSLEGESGGSYAKGFSS